MVIYVESHVWTNEFPAGGKWTPQPGDVDYFMHVIIGADQEDWVLYEPIADLDNTIEKMLRKLRFQPGICFGPD